MIIFSVFVSALIVENGKFLLSAKRTRRTTRTEYIISMDAENISRSSNSYLGKLRFCLNLCSLNVILIHMFTY